MKTPLWFPQSFFARTLWMVLIVVLFSKVLTLVYLMTNEDVLVDRAGVVLTEDGAQALVPPGDLAERRRERGEGS